MSPIPEGLFNCRENMYWIQRTVVLTYYYLLRLSRFLENDLNIEDFYEKCISKVLKEGGDASTNASLTGCIIGSAIGLSAIPSSMTTKLIKCKVTSKPRPDFVNTQQNLLSNIKNLVENIPSGKIDAIIFEIQKSS